MDFYFTGAGDIAVSPAGDIALTPSSWRDDAQQVYIRMMTEPGDFLLYPMLGANLQSLYGMPQSEATGERGRELILQALSREGRFQNQGLDVRAVPTGPQTIRFDIYVSHAGQSTIALSIEQDLALQQ